MQEMYGKTDLEKFVFFIKEFKENLSQYKRVVIRIDFPDKHHNSLDYVRLTVIGRMILLFVFVFIIVMIKSLLG
jgi:hypothetical protein